ncbi:hypothetical protein QNO07_24690 [Streptomyces sp. 549]|uniref:hypothetical protein n=1 Tax=Streptomyces sp. 549 TaxID=3049076 RepID=UPI0024C36A16|nr:hypothetical protein [Streptomyces sp. 549]MDK1476563.1 hypothetical protein [Streptomyces sp. 549]
MSEPARTDRPAPDSASQTPASQISEAQTSAGAEAQGEPSQPEAKRAALDFGDPLSQQSSDDSDSGWGERPASSAGDLARFLDEKPPHHI